MIFLRRHIPIAGFLTPLLLLFAGPAAGDVGTDQPPNPPAALGQQPNENARVALWEIGVAGGAIYGPDYPASEESHLRGLALPYAIYRGEIFRLGDGNLASVVPVDAEWVELDVSVGAAFDADSDDNDAREGMPDLDYLFEFGPQVTIHLLHGPATKASRQTLDLNLQARAVFSTDLSDVAHRGYVLSPELAFRRKRFLGAPLQLRASIAPIWATEELMDYFYEVRPRFANANRPAFDAQGGYLGTEVGLGLAWDVTDWLRLRFGTRWAYHGGARNEDSPLFTDSRTVAFGASFKWAMWQSEETVPER